MPNLFGRTRRIIDVLLMGAPTETRNRHHLRSELCAAILRRQLILNPLVCLHIISTLTNHQLKRLGGVRTAVSVRSALPFSRS
jgi:hypothetical protein